MSQDTSNINVVSNIWICIDDPEGPGNSTYAASQAMPGDLAFNILVPHTDLRFINRAVLDGTLTKKQAKEREFFRHFAPHNHLDDPRITGDRSV